MKNAVIYIRVSTEEQVKHGYSIDAQTKSCVNFALQNGFNVDKIFTEEGLSAKDLNRLQLKEMLSYCRKNKRKIDALIFWKWDRLSRGEDEDYVILGKIFKECDMTPLSVTECNEDSPEGELLRWITKGTNRYELRKISQRTTFGMREKAEQGQLPAKAPIGYLNFTAPDGKKSIIIDDKNAFFVKRAFDLYAGGGYSLKSLGDTLAKDGFVDKFGKKYPPRKFEWMLKNVTYIGKFMWSKAIYEGNHAPIVSKEVFYAVQARFSDSRKTRQKTHDIFFPYAGLIKCAKCGKYLTAEYKRGAHNSGDYIYYNCTGKKKGECNIKSIKQEIIENTLLDILGDIYIPQNVIAGIKDRAYQMLKDIDEYETENVDTIKKKIDTLQKRIQKSYIDKLDGNLPTGMSEEEWSLLQGNWQAEKDHLYIRLKEISENTKIMYGRLDLLLKFCNKIPEYFSKALEPEKRQIILTMVRTLTYDGSKLDVELHPVFDKFRILPKNKNGAGDGVRTHAYRYHKPRP